jgi:hypothetical protein
MLLASAMIVRAAMLDGTKWKVKVVPDKATAEKGGKTFNDELIFANGEFTSRALLRNAFKSSKYKVETEPGAIGFEVEQFRATNDVAIWIGDTRGTNIIGGLQWKKKVHGDFIYEFTGTKE